MSAYADQDDLRSLARGVAEADLRLLSPALRLGPIRAAALRAALPWRAARAVGWEWDRVVKRREPSRFELAIWHGDTLCGLAYGPAAPEWVAIAYLQGNPDPAHPLKRRVVDVAVAVLEAQALAAGAPETRLLRPVPELVEHYGRRGYRRAVAPEAGLDYLRRLRGDG